MVKIAPDDFKVFIRVPKGTPMVQLKNLVASLKRKDVITLIPEGWEVLVIRGNGVTDKL